MNEDKFYKSQKDQKEIVNKYKETVSTLKFLTRVFMYLREEYNITQISKSTFDVNDIIETCFKNKENVPNTANKLYLFLKNQS